MFQRRFPAKTGSENGPVASTGVGPRFGVAPPTNPPISGRLEDVGFSGDISSRKSRNRILGIFSEIHSVGVLDSGGLFSRGPVACFRGHRRKLGTGRHGEMENEDG